MRRGFVVIGIVALVLAAWLDPQAFAHGGRERGWGEVHEEGRKERRHGRCADHGGESLAAAGNQAYLDSCGGCHMAYRPDLLPAASWTAILDGLPGHYGQRVEVDVALLGEVRTFLETGAADKADTELGREIAASLSGAAPTRLTEIPFLIREHGRHGFSADCGRCHRGS